MPTLSTSMLGTCAIAGLLAGCDARSAMITPAEASAQLSLPSGPAANAYGHALQNLQRAHWQDVRDGKGIFVATWAAIGGGEAEQRARGPAAQVREGLGPLFHATSCEGCHFKDGRGGPPPDLRRRPATPDAARVDRSALPLLLRIGLVGEEGALLAEPTYGLQLQDRAVSGQLPEGRFTVEWAGAKGHYADGSAFRLTAPRPVIQDLSEAPLHAKAVLSLRHPSSLIGLGLLEAVTEAAIVELADPEDRDGDGISGRVARVRDVASGALALGRFGWKASQPSLRAQNAAALREDLGVTTSIYPDEHARSSAPELSDEDLDKLTRYLRLLEPPARRDALVPSVVRGERLFSSFGCAACHRPSWQTGDVADLPELSRRTIEPYSDLLLHDMGDGLADHRPEGGASGREWRTAPLWGLGLLGAVSGSVHLLHDGRARSVEEAILWHGGEAQSAREQFRRASAAERTALLAFLASL